MKISLLRSLFFATLLLSANILLAQDFMMQGFFWDYPSQFGIQRWGQNYLLKVPELADAGFTYVWLPPLSRASGDQASTGYDVQDYYDLGQYSLGATRFGTRKDLDKLITAFRAKRIHAVGDLIYNHRAGGNPEDNSSVKGWIENMNITKINNGDQPFPSDRFWCYITLGDTSGNGPGTYYVKIRSASQSANFYGKQYMLRMWTTKVPLALDSVYDSYEFEPNNGGSCGDTSNSYILGTRKYANIDNAGCGIDEFSITLDTSMFKTTGDTLWISMANIGTNLGDFSDHYVFGLYSASLSADIKSQVHYQTFTDFAHLPSGQGAMNHTNFKPNGNPTQLSGDWDQMLFFYDVDQNVNSTLKVISDWTQYMFDSVGIDGMRLDAVKNYPSSFVAHVLDSLHSHGTNPSMVVGEFYDYNPSSLKGWVDDVQSQMAASTRDSVHVRAFDFALRGALKASCDQFGYDVRNVFTSGMVNGAGASGYNVVTWITNHDTRDSNLLIKYNPELPYAYILTNNQIGMPCVFHTDYFANGFMRGRIKGLMKAHKRYIAGANSIDYLSGINSTYNNFFVKGFNNTTLIYQLHNTKQVIAAINYSGDSLDVYQKVNTSNIAVGDTFTNIYGVVDTLTTITANNEIHVKLPPRSFTVYVQGNLKDSLISLNDSTLARDTVIVTPGIAETEVANPIHVYPNPFSNYLDIELGVQVNGVLSTEVWDLTGKRVYAKSFINGTTNHLQIDPGINVAGFYLLKVTANGKEHYFKLVKN